jgi:hypothetical protein
MSHVRKITAFIRAGNLQKVRRVGLVLVGGLVLVSVFSPAFLTAGPPPTICPNCVLRRAVFEVPVGIMAGWLQSVEGGHATSAVIVEDASIDRVQKKHLAGVKYEDITITTGTGMSKEFYDWIKDTPGLQVCTKERRYHRHEP